MKAAKLLMVALSVRALLMVSLLGAFILAIIAMIHPDAWGLGVLVAYSLLTVIPNAVLEFRKPR